MLLYIVRHGRSQSRSSGIPDAERTLTEEGRRRTGQVAEALGRIGCTVNRIATSPLPRCEETARIIADRLAVSAPLETLAGLKPGAEADDVLEWLAGLDVDAAMVVGHGPDVADIAAELLCGAGGLDIRFRKAAVCCLSFDAEPQAGMARLEWLGQPRQLRAVARAEPRRDREAPSEEDGP